MATKKPQVLLTLDDELLERIEDYRYGNRIPTRSEAIRSLIKIGLEKIVTEKPHVPK
jgi:metal-responsive CopG/Arc/MetJ family transcriptional regulator